MKLIVFWKAGLPYMIAGLAIVFGGIWLIKHFLSGHPSQNLLFIFWLGLFWLIYQPMLYRRIRSVKNLPPKSISSISKQKDKSQKTA